MFGPLGKPSHRAVTLAVLLCAAALAGRPQSAQAQFFFWDHSRFSADDIARIAMQHGFRPIAKPQRTDNVYLADVVDQRGRRERLVVSAESGEVLQRFFLDDGHGYRRYADPSIPRGPLPPGRVPDDDSQNLFSRLTPQDQGRDVMPDDEMVRPPPRAPRPRKPRAAAVAPDTPRETPVESAPLAPVPPTAPPPLRPAPPPVHAPAQAALPPAASRPVAPPPVPAVSPPSDKPGRSISSDPLAIPGSRDHDDAQAAAKPRPPVTAGSPAATTPKPPAPAKPVMPVAPLE